MPCQKALFYGYSGDWNRRILRQIAKYSWLSSLLSSVTIAVTIFASFTLFGGVLGSLSDCPSALGVSLCCEGMFLCSPEPL